MYVEEDQKEFFDSIKLWTSHMEEDILVWTCKNEKIRVFNDGYREYYLNGQLHNQNGYAVIFPDGDGRYYLNGKEFSEEEFKSRRVWILKS